MHTKELRFRGATGEWLSARLELPPDQQPIACALFAHCFTCSKNLNAAVHISRALTQERCAVLRFDFTGLGESEGEFAQTTFSSNVADLVAAARFMEREGLSPEILIGHSLGGAAVIRAVGQIPSARGVVTIGAPFDPWHVSRLFQESHAAIEAAGEATVNIGGRPFRVGKQLLDDLRSASLENDLRELGRALLVLHSPLDQVVGIDHAAEIFRAARHPKSFVSLDRADHLLSDERDSRYVAAVVAGWASRYLPVSEPRVNEDPPRGDRVVAVTGRTPYRTEVLAGGHMLVADEPLRLGGQDAGPTPYDFLMTALGACTGITLRMYADRKDWPLEEVTVHLRHRKLSASDPAPDSGEVRVDHIEEVLELSGPLDAQQRARLLEIAARCPVYRTLRAGVQIETTLADDAALDQPEDSG
jgi:uncharacterized OsmC-like protein/pimeloyl-ACP methyl ester carboxylesterase